MSSSSQPRSRARRLVDRLVGRTALAIGAVLASTLAGAVTPRPAAGQWVTTFEQFYFPAEHNWVYRTQYPFADRLFNAFDYGHSILYEELYMKPNASPARLEQRQYDFLTKRVLPNPPRVPLEEVAIEIQYARLAPEAKQMFEWAHVLHRQAYDVLADERLDQAAKDREMAKLLAYYKSRPDVKFSSVPKSMKLMQEQPYSLAFRRRYPKFNGLIWGYHWMQVGLYEPLLVGRTFAERQALSTAAVARFRQMLEDAPRSMPYQMPMTAAVAPEFARRYPEQAIIFDNLHSMHDVISDILANDSVPRSRKRAEIVRAGNLFRDDTSYVMGSTAVNATAAWRAMSAHMGVENMGGPAVGFTPALPAPTVTRGAVMSHDDRTGQMVGFKYGQATGGDHAGHAGTPSAGATNGAQGADAHAGHDAASATPAACASPVGGSTDHAAMGHGSGTGTGNSAAAAGAAPEGRATSGAQAAQHGDLHMRMMADPVIRQRVMADTAMHRRMMASMRSMPAEHREQMQSMMHGTGNGAAATPARKAATRPTIARPSGGRRTSRATRLAAPRPATPADAHAGHGRASAAPARPAARPAPRDSMAGMDHSKHQMGRP